MRGLLNSSRLGVTLLNTEPFGIRP